MDQIASMWFEVPYSCLLAQYQDDCDGPSLPEQLFKLIKNTYEQIGGYADFKTWADLPGDHTRWKVYGTPGRATAVIFGKNTTFGTKWTGCASNGVFDVKFAMFEQFFDLLVDAGNYAEVSGMLAHCLLKRNVRTVQSEELVRAFVDKPLVWLKDGWYERMCHGQKRSKILVGRPVL